MELEQRLCVKMQAAAIISKERIGLCLLLSPSEISGLFENKPVLVPLAPLGVNHSGFVKLLCATHEVRQALKIASMNSREAVMTYVVSLKQLRRIKRKPTNLVLWTNNQLDDKEVVMRVASSAQTTLDELIKKGREDADLNQEGRG